MKFEQNTSICVNIWVFGCFDGSPCDRPTDQGLRFSTWLRERANGVPTPNPLFVQLTVSAVEAPTVTQILVSDR